MTTDALFIKVCGITRLTDALHAVEHGATAVGFVLWPRSPRAVTVERAADIIAELPSNVMTVGVFVNEPVDAIRQVVERARLTAVQLHGDEPPAYADALDWPVIRAVSVNDISGADAWSTDTALLVDNIDPLRRGGTGTAIDWSQAAGIAQKRRVVLAGGLTPDNVASAIRAVRPYGVDVSSGVESAPGVKDFDKVAQFIANARGAFEELQ
ncbi:MAG TPA: phosphoribosylanthranilate isomerase [Vicinamibacterales bacterium]|jgi:phosphoribosylanthranilate isomerase|nr:phosphoribosylanthranilate isomerase [Vicinamibacterales bacterium]